MAMRICDGLFGKECANEATREKAIRTHKRFVWIGRRRIFLPREISFAVLHLCAECNKELDMQLMQIDRKYPNLEAVPR